MAMRFHAQDVSASAAGDYFQLSFSPRQRTKGFPIFMKSQVRTCWSSGSSRLPMAAAATSKRTMKATGATFAWFDQDSAALAFHSRSSGSPTLMSRSRLL